MVGAWPEASEMLGKAIWCLQNARKRFGGWGSTPDPAGGAYSAPPDPLAGGEGAASPLPKNLTDPPPLSAFQASGFGPHLSAPQL